jgi:hypothetical protein
MPYIIENLTQYDLSDDEAATLTKMGFVFHSDEAPNPDEREVTAFVWGDLGLEGDRAFDLFDAVLGRKKD